MSLKNSPPSERANYPSQDLVHRLVEHPAFAGVEVAKLCFISEQRFQQWITRKIVDVGNNKHGRQRLYTLHHVLLVSITARISDSHDINPSTAKLLATVGAGKVIRAWFQAAGDLDVAASQAVDIHGEIEKRGGYLLPPNPFGSLDDAETYLSEADIMVVPADGRLDAEMHSYAASDALGDVIAELGSPVFVMDLAPICKGILKPAAEILRRRVVISQPGIPEEVWDQWRRDGNIPAELTTA